MPRTVELAQQWTFASTGRGQGFVDARMCDRLGFFVETVANSTATIQLETARDSTSFACPLGPAVNLNASSGVFLQFDGPFGFVAPRVTDGNSTGVRVYAVGV